MKTQAVPITDLAVMFQPLVHVVHQLPDIQSENLFIGEILLAQLPVVFGNEILKIRPDFRGGTWLQTKAFDGENQWPQQRRHHQRAEDEDIA
jgi:hypothetical protein